MKTISFLLLFVVFLLTSFSNPQQVPQTNVLTTDQEQAIIKELKSKVDLIVEGINKLDADLALTDMDGKHFYRFINNGYIVDDYESTYMILKNNYAGLKELKLTITDESYTVLSPNSALHSARFMEEFSDVSDNKFSFKGAWTAVFQKIDQVWKVVHVHQSVTPAGQ